MIDEKRAREARRHRLAARIQVSAVNDEKQTGSLSSIIIGWSVLRVKRCRPQSGCRRLRKLLRTYGADGRIQLVVVVSSNPGVLASFAQKKNLCVKQK